MSDIFASMMGRSSLPFCPAPVQNYTSLGGFGKPLTQSTSVARPVSSQTSIASAPQSETQSGGAYTSLWHYLMPTAEKIFNFGPGDYYTEKMKQHPGVVDARESIQDQLAAACKVTCDPSVSGRVAYSIGARSLLGQGWDLFKTTLGTVTGGWIGSDPDYGTIGSLSTKSSWDTQRVDCKLGLADVEFSLSNQMGLSSNSRFSYDGTRPQTSIFGNDPFGDSGSLGTVYQNWGWKEALSFEPNLSCPPAADVN